MLNGASMSKSSDKKNKTDENDEFYGKYLSKLMIKEWELSEREGMITKLEEEHSNSLALIMENEAQKIHLEELNKKLTNAAIIAEKDMKMAINVQRSLLFQKPPITENYDIAFYFQPMSGVSGDFYDFYVENNLLTGVLLSDVSGHGISSGLITAIAKPIFFRKFTKNYTHPLEEVMYEINHLLIKEIGSADNYLTAVILRFADDRAEYVNAAHPHIIIKKRNSTECRIINPDGGSIQGPFLGESSIIQPYKSHTFHIKTDDVILLYTDGLTESRNADGEEFGVDNIYKAISNSSDNNTSDEILKMIINSFYTFISSQAAKDDITLIVIKKK